MTHRLRLALLLPGLAFLAVSFILPLIWVIGISFTGTGQPGFTVATYLSVLTDPFYWRVAGNSLLFAALVAAFTVLLSYPLGLFLARTQSRWRGVLVTLNWPLAAVLSVLLLALFGAVMAIYAGVAARTARNAPA